MSRPLRIEFPDAWYYFMNRARLGQETFPAREDYLGFIELLMDASEKFNMRVAAYCLMANHRQMVFGVVAFGPTLSAKRISEAQAVAGFNRVNP